MSAVKRMLLLALLLASAASGADLRDVKDPAKIKAVFPSAAKLRVVNIWATWCVPCVGEMPELRAVDAAFGPEVALVGVSTDDAIPEASRAKVAAFLDKQKIGYINVYYRGNVDDLTRYYRFEGEIPITIAFDRGGKEVWRHEGPIRSAEAIDELRKLLRRMR
jgi:thiol-disulfide isomerase/thioredoxin